jgi:hypothetical protein
MLCLILVATRAESDVRSKSPPMQVQRCRDPSRGVYDGHVTKRRDLARGV